MLTFTGTLRFVSDLHLTAERAAVSERFAAFLADTARAKATALFILGDLFEYWIGDDDLADPFAARIAGLLRQLATSGTRIFFIAGNRDFLIGENFCRASDMIRLADMQKVGVGDTAILLMHGDTLCTDDVAYQVFRRTVRSAAWQREFLSRSLTERRAEVTDLRRRSQRAMEGKSAQIMDVNPDAVRATLAASGCIRLIHGHTHRPGREQLTLADGSAAERWVLSDWGEGRGDALEVDAGGIRRIDWSGR
ncbi:MAG: UDP-2,3-diacylglucosamine diphosphatase [Betaproteobacteria bacterium HGW-Betaproteobacteria-11]|nr:MAG: UDP-2,3-diacylglucosamine diphosphatase [Betaproteobacteria bacterium HGW-Betaproteobacteria-11]